MAGAGRRPDVRPVGAGDRRRGSGGRRRTASPVASMSTRERDDHAGIQRLRIGQRRAARAVEHALGDEMGRAVGVDVREADGDAEDVDVRRPRGGPPARVRGSTGARPAAGSCRSGSSASSGRWSPGSPNGTPPDHRPSVDPDGRIDERGGRRRPRRRPSPVVDVGQASAGPEVEPALGGARRRPGRLGPPPPGLSSRSGRQRTRLLHEHRDRRLVHQRRSSRPRHQWSSQRTTSRRWSIRGPGIAGVRVAVVPRADEQLLRCPSGARTVAAAGSGSRRASRR